MAWKPGTHGQDPAVQFAAMATWPPTPDTQAQLTCVHCLGASVSCCVCANQRVTALAVALEAASWAWARRGCGCGACAEAGPRPGSWARSIAAVA